MTDTLGSAASATGKAKGAAKDANPLTDLAHSEAADRLKEEAQEYLSAQAQRLLTGLGRKLGETTGKLNDIAEGKSPGFASLALDGGRKLAEGKGPLRTALELGASRAKDNVMDAVKNIGGGKKGGKGRSGNKPTVIMEFIDVGVPLRTAYDQWTQFQDFSTFAHGVKSVSRAGDTETDWQAKIFLSSRSWKARTTEQIPDQRIQWTSEGAKGSTKGVVTFHALGDNLTRVLLVIEYYPSGFFEKTGNLWRAQGRRVRLDLKHFARFISLKAEADDGWRGEIRDGEVVRSHEDAVAEEESEESDESEEAEDRDSGEPEDRAEDQESGEPEEYEDEEDGSYEDEAEDEDRAEEPEEDDEEQEDEYEDEEPEDEEYEGDEEEEPEYAERGSRR
ncbi:MULTISPECIES: SRPBCC family protein [Streptomyces]|uniref:Putative membrane protein n=1 Tax=Streptomyces murinus TaxID=33900 RepID=A0A7W3NUX6_STRMR|nr:SRPBCC family protein [Streptomyces murinus]MBA9057137.1 putative membrane protein [Streptomyces murinus]UWW91490.1 cyclase [Streptomyces murinus]WSI88750.1 SRPBCC family protein [Streptomyces murinus]